MVAAAASPPILCSALPSRGNSSLRTLVRMELYRGESLGLGDVGTAVTGKSSSTGSLLNLAVDTSGLRWYDSMSAVQSRPMARFRSHSPPGCLS